MGWRPLIVTITAVLACSCGSHDQGGASPTMDAAPIPMSSATARPVATPSPRPTSSPRLAAGAPDPAFGDSGLVVIPIDGARRPVSYDMRVEPDGQVHLASVWRGSGTTREVLTVDLDPDGAVHAAGVRSLLDATANRMLAEFSPSGGVVVAAGGNPDEPSFVTRFVGGQIDDGFGHAGVAPIAAGSPGSLHILEDGRILVSGSERTIEQLRPDGSIDHGFGDEGVVVLEFEPDAGEGIGILGDGSEGRILILVSPSLIGNPVFLMALTPDGSPDSTYALGRLVPISGSGLGAVGVLPSGAVLARSSRRSEFVRVGPRGTIDDGFDSPDLDVEATAFDVTPDGHIVMSGTTSRSSRDGAALVLALDSSGGVVPTFGSSGVPIDFGHHGPYQSTSAETVAAMPEGRVTVAGRACGEDGCDLFVYRLGAPAPDATPR